MSINAPLKNPYENLPGKAFWRTSIAERSFFQVSDLWEPKWPIEANDKFATAGSCFAQHISRSLQALGYRWVEGEIAPPMLSEQSRRQFNYGVFSFRTGNIYTAELLQQWVAASLGKITLPNETWEQGGRFLDPLRPKIEPNGFSSREECLNSRENTLHAIKQVLRSMDVLIFTMGLTEAWIDTESGLVYPSCPGTLGGKYKPARHIFKNYEYSEILATMSKTFKMIKSINKDVRFLLTVSPVPLIATAAPGQHVLVANTFSKSTLRAVAGSLVNARDDTDYFPSYEIISAISSRAVFYEPNLREVTPEGVNFVMKNFIACMEAKFGPISKRDMKKRKAVRTRKGNRQNGDVVCEERIQEFYNAH